MGRSQLVASCFRSWAVAAVATCSRQAMAPSAAGRAWLRRAAVGGAGALHTTLGASLVIGAAFSSLSDAAVMVPIGLALLVLGLLGLRGWKWRGEFAARQPSLTLALFEIGLLILVLAIGFIFLLFVATYSAPYCC